MRKPTGIEIVKLFQAGVIGGCTVAAVLNDNPFSRFCNIGLVIVNTYLYAPNSLVFVATEKLTVKVPHPMEDDDATLRRNTQYEIRRKVDEISTQFYRSAQEYLNQKLRAAYEQIDDAVTTRIETIRRANGDRIGLNPVEPAVVEPEYPGEVVWD
jgi:hypothetical protein